jgi:BirA family transcriptional regulator, biotin operon repressor / biotin---[acetyl-CoA-carboxylase] ligase
MYDLALLNAALAGTIFAGKLRYSASTGSTNDDAKSAASNAAPHGSVFLADEQTAGRGRGDHEWLSAAGEGLYVSVLLRPQIPPTRLTLLPLVAGLAAADAIRAAVGIAVDLRWPNDLLVGLRKTGGILVESNIEHHAVAYAVVGIGINAHQRGFAPDLATPATSLDLETGARVSRQQLLIALLELLDQGVIVLAGATAVYEVPAQVERTSTWVRGRKVEVHGPQACTGITEGLDEHGFLRVRTAAGLVTITTGGLRDAPG